MANNWRIVTAENVQLLRTICPGQHTFVCLQTLQTSPTFEQDDYSNIWGERIVKWRFAWFECADALETVPDAQDAADSLKQTILAFCRIPWHEQTWPKAYEDVSQEEMVAKRVQVANKLVAAAKEVEALLLQELSV